MGGQSQEASASQCTPSFASRCIALLSRMPLDWQRNGHPAFCFEVNKSKHSPLGSSRAVSARQAALYGSQSAEMPPPTAHPATFATRHLASKLCAASAPENAALSLSTAAKCPRSGTTGVDTPQASSSAVDEPPAIATASDIIAASESLIAGGGHAFPRYDMFDLISRTLASSYNLGCEPRLPGSGSGDDSTAVQQRRPDTSVPGLLLGDLFVSAVSR